MYVLCRLMADCVEKISSYPHFSASRLFFRQTFGLGGVQETLESAHNQLADKVDVSRLTVQVGKFPVSDLFDGNTYARDNRNGFVNWAIWAAGAFDYAADRVGLGYGATAELNQKNWALRAGYFLMDAESNSSKSYRSAQSKALKKLRIEIQFTAIPDPHAEK